MPDHFYNKMLNINPNYFCRYFFEVCSEYRTKWKQIRYFFSLKLWIDCYGQSKLCQVVIHNFSLTLTIYSYLLLIYQVLWLKKVTTLNPTTLTRLCLFPKTYPELFVYLSNFNTQFNWPIISKRISPLHLDFEHIHILKFHKAFFLDEQLCILHHSLYGFIQYYNMFEVYLRWEAL